ncbi:MAG TPA: hypothetical protein VNN20_03615 [Thermodesulfobacteriota bacterium]|nr:hypothetical protein [Thermodesulfobacteriota bacterium]
MRIILTLFGFFLLSACAGGNYTSDEEHIKIRQRDICAEIPVGIARFQYMDPSLKNLKISCADVARCAALTGGTPANVPCQ